MSATVKIALNGMNNKERDAAIPKGKAKLAVNCQFDSDGNILFPRPGKTVKYTGDCKWLHEGKDVTLFVEGGDLKRLNSDNTATIVKAGVGGNYISYTIVGTDTYWSNGFASGIVDSTGINREWGTEAPARQPDCTPVTFGGMFGGEYRVAITYLGSTGEEGPTGNSVRLTVPEGGGIHVDNFPTPTSTITGVAVYVSSVNGEDLYLYGEYAANVSDITLTKRICTIPLLTQFAWVPQPQDVILAHYGRIYYAVGSLLYFTEIMRYGIQMGSAYWAFDSNVQTIISCPNVLYVGTQNKVYSIRNIDGDGAAVIAVEKECGTVKSSEAYHQDGVTAFCMSGRGILAFKSEGVTELSYKDMAFPFYESGTTTIQYQDGIETLVFIGQGETLNPLAYSG